jgi:alkylhydroperoxidase family enzyme
MRHRGKPTALLDVEKSGPLSAFVNALDGLPMARDLRIMIDRLWESSSLPPRTISVLLAVVARALGSLRCEQEARELLLEQGFANDDIEQLLTHLSSSALSAIEQALVPLARETVWYQPAQIQRRCAELQSQMSNEQFLDFLGAVSLLNSLCRLEVIIGLSK